MRKDSENTIQDSRKLSNYRIERFNKVEQILKPDLNYPNATIHDKKEDSENYSELLGRYLVLSKLDFTFWEIYDYLKFNYKVSKYLKRNK